MFDNKTEAVIRCTCENGRVSSSSFRSNTVFCISIVGGRLRLAFLLVYLS